MDARLHIGSGTVYLAPGWLNIDVSSPRVFLAAERPDLVERYRTTEDRYYARHQEFARLAAFAVGPQEAQYVCDVFGRWDALPCRDGEAVEVLGRQTWEHLSEGEAHLALREVERVLAPGGVLRLSVPDHEATLRLYGETRDPILVRHLLGPRNGSNGFHLMSYTHASLRSLIESHGRFAFVGDERNIHAYPALCMTWRRE